MDNVNLEKLAKELLKKIIDNNRELSEQEKVGIKVIIDEEHDPEKTVRKVFTIYGVMIAVVFKVMLISRKCRICYHIV